MKKFVLSIALLSAPLIASANNFNMPSFNNGNGFNNGSSWNMPTMNWGNGNNTSNNGTSWGNNFNMPTMNWGNGNNGFNNGSNWNMPNMNWGNSNNGANNGSNWDMPTMNWGNSNNNQPWSFGNSFGNANNTVYVPNAQYHAPAIPVAPQFIPRLNTKNKVAPVATKAATVAPAKMNAPAMKMAPIPAVQTKIPMPSQVKGTILAPANKNMKVEAPK